MRRLIVMLSLTLVFASSGCSHMRGNEANIGVESSSEQEYFRFSDSFRHFDSVLFPFDSTHLTNEAMKAADELLTEFKKRPSDKLVLEGNTCDLGTMDYNLALGAKRALAVQAYVIRQGIDPSRISIVSFGEENPIALNDNETNRKQNRRVDFWFVPPEHPAWPDQ